MTKERQQQHYKNMDEVIETSKKIREFLLSDDVSKKEKMESLETIKMALIANKSIISATGHELAIERITKVSENE